MTNLNKKIEKAIDDTLPRFVATCEEAIASEEEYNAKKAARVAKAERRGDYDYAQRLSEEEFGAEVMIDDAYDEARAEVQRAFGGDDDYDEIESAVMDACDEALESLRS